jgi:hypothetical protein
MPRSKADSDPMTSARIGTPFAVAACLALAAALSLAPPAAAEGASEYEIKAAFLFNFSKFIEWPAGAFAGDADPITICVLGRNPFGNLLDETVRDKTVNGRELAVREMSSPAAATGCKIVFISTSEQERFGEALGALADRPLLTVSDAAMAAERGAIIGLVLDENRVRFEVNLDAARRSGLRVGSQVLKVAVRLLGPAGRGR